MDFMENINDIKRKYARFPAFTDEEGVKLHSDKTDSSFSKDEDWILTDIDEDSIEKRSLPDVKAAEHSTRRNVKNSDEMQQKELQDHRDHLPDYNHKSVTKSKEMAGHSYFVPKYVPASVIPDKKEKVSERELFRSMHKNQEDYLVFDTKSADFQEKDKSLVHKFR